MRVTSRKEWKAAKPKAPPTKMANPATKTYIHHSVTVQPQSTVKDEKEAMRQLQGIAFGREFNDISYSFIIFPSGRVYEGRGWQVVGAHTEGSNSTSHAFCFVGNFEISKPTKEALEAAGKLHRRGIERGFIADDAPIKGHRDAPGAATACPGRHLQAKLRKIRKAAREEKTA